jgi:hypothetical protein
MEGILTTLLSQYGPPGLAIAVLMIAVYRLAKRLKAIEDRKDAAHAAELERERKRTLEYAKLVKTTTETIGKLTGCMRGISDTMKEIKDYIREKEKGS